jgi:hypothetical protein
MNGGGEPALAPKLRIVPREHTPLGENPSPGELGQAIADIETNLNHNFRAVIQELDDVRSSIRHVGMAAAEGLATGHRVEALLTGLVEAVQGVVVRLGAIEGRLERQEAPTQPVLPQDPA